MTVATVGRRWTQLVVEHNSSGTVAFQLAFELLDCNDQSEAMRDPAGEMFLLKNIGETVGVPYRAATNDATNSPQ